MLTCGKKLTSLPFLMECDRCDWRGYEVIHSYEGSMDGEVEPVDICPECGWYVSPEDEVVMVE